MSLPPFYEFTDYSACNERSGELLIHKNAVFAPHTHQVVSAIVRNKTLYALISGRVIADKLVKKCSLTMEELTGEMRGGEPMPDDDPRKPALVLAAKGIVEAASRIADKALSRDYDTQLADGLAANGKYPEFIPLTINAEGRELNLLRTELIYGMAGGQFTIPVGMAFHYTDISLDTYPEGSPVMWHTYRVFFGDTPEEYAETQSAGLRALIHERNMYFETSVGGWLEDAIEEILATLPEIPPKPVPEPAPMEAANDPAPPPAES